MIIESTILMPKDVQTDAEFSRLFKTDTDIVSIRVLVLRCHLRKAGIVWRGLRPCLMQSRKRTAMLAVSSLVELLSVPFPALKTVGNSGNSSPFEEEKWKSRINSRRLRLLHNANASNRSSYIKEQRNARPHRLLIWIQPPSTTYFHTYFTCAMVAWEHKMILFQSLAALCSTLGGGHFFCRHLNTAVALAQQQRRIAILMGDYNMAYKCTINEAYSYIYAGKFALALQTIDSIPLLNKRIDIHPLDPVIVNMCQSARLFCKRVRKASKRLETSKTKKEALTKDDYQRIRVVIED